MEMSLTSLGSSHTFLRPQPRTEEASLFCSLRETCKEMTLGSRQEGGRRAALARSKTKGRSYVVRCRGSVACQAPGIPRLPAACRVPLAACLNTHTHHGAPSVSPDGERGRDWREAQPRVPGGIRAQGQWDPSGLGRRSCSDHRRIAFRNRDGSLRFRSQCAACGKQPASSPPLRLGTSEALRKSALSWRGVLLCENPAS